MSCTISLKEVPTMVSRFTSDCAIVGHVTNPNAASWLNHWMHCRVGLCTKNSTKQFDALFDVYYDTTGPTGYDPTGRACWTAKSIVAYLMAQGYEVLTDPNCGTWADGTLMPGAYMQL